MEGKEKERKGQKERKINLVREVQGGGDGGSTELGLHHRRLVSQKEVIWGAPS